MLDYEAALSLHIEELYAEYNEISKISPENMSDYLRAKLTVVSDEITSLVYILDFGVGPKVTGTKANDNISSWKEESSFRDATSMHPKLYAKPEYSIKSKLAGIASVSRLEIDDEGYIYLSERTEDYLDSLTFTEDELEFMSNKKVKFCNDNYTFSFEYKPHIAYLDVTEERDFWEFKVIDFKITDNAPTKINPNLIASKFVFVENVEGEYDFYSDLDD